MIAVICARKSIEHNGVSNEDKSSAGETERAKGCAVNL